MDHEPVKISILFTDVLCCKIKWKARHHTPALVVAVTVRAKASVVALDQLPGPIPLVDPPTSLTTEICGTFDIFSIYNWDNLSDKSKCLNMATLFLLEKYKTTLVTMLALCRLLWTIFLREIVVIVIKFGPNCLSFCDLKYLIAIYRFKDPCLLHVR